MLKVLQKKMDEMFHFLQKPVPWVTREDTHCKLRPVPYTHDFRSSGKDFSLRSLVREESAHLQKCTIAWHVGVQ